MQDPTPLPSGGGVAFSSGTIPGLNHAVFAPLLANFAAACSYRPVSRIIVITGTDTGVGKTLLTALLAAYLRAQGVKVAALKPLCSGGRADARLLRRALGDSLPLDTINPWHFRAPVTPLLAARAEKRSVRLASVISHVRSVARSAPRPDWLLIEGAGGLLSPLGEEFSTRELILRLRAQPLIVGVNKLGVVNHVLLTLAALPPSFAAKARVVLMSEARSDRASQSNVNLLAEYLSRKRISVLPHFKNADDFESALATPTVCRTLESLLK